MSRSVPDDRIVIGRIGAPHGVRGDLRIIPLTDFPERFAQMREVMAGDELLHITAVKPQGRNILMHFREYDVRETAQRLTGRVLTVPRAEAAPLDEGEYYVFDIVGLTVRDVYAVRDAEGHELLVPALRTVVQKIDIAGGCMTVRLPE